MYNTPKQSNSSSNIRHDQRKLQSNQGNKNSNYRKQNRYEDYEDDNEQHYKPKGQNISSKKHQPYYQGNEYSNGKKPGIGKRYYSNEASFYIEYKGKQVDIGSGWKEMVQAVDKCFGKTDMVFNLALKINVWQQMKDNPDFAVTRDDVDGVFELYGKYRDRGY